VKNVLVAAALVAVVMGEPHGAGAEPSPPALQACTVIPVVMIDTIDSGKAHAGDVFRFRTIDTIVAPGNATIPHDATGYGIITQAVAAGPHGKAGNLVVEARYVELTGRRRFPVTIDGVATLPVQSGSSGTLNAPSLPIPFAGTAIGALNYLRAGKNAVIRAGFRFTVMPVPDLAKGLKCAP
jgi:hypothetical protein